MLVITVVALGVTVNLPDADVYPPETLGYGTVFLAGLLTALGSNSTVVTLTIVPAAGVMFNPVSVGVMAAFGSAIGEISGYVIGYGSRGIMSRESSQDFWSTRTYNKLFSWRLFARLEDNISKWTTRYPFLILYFLAAIPNVFFDLAGMVAGRKGYPYPRFFLAAFLGKATRFVLIAFAGKWSLHLLSSS